MKIWSKEVRSDAIETELFHCLDDETMVRSQSDEWIINNLLLEAGMFSLVSAWAVSPISDGIIELVQRYVKLKGLSITFERLAAAPEIEGTISDEPQERKA